MMKFFNKLNTIVYLEYKVICYRKLMSFNKDNWKI